MDKKKEALAQHLEFEPDEVKTADGYEKSVYEAEGRRWEVWTDAEADEEAQRYIERQLWSFKTDFLLNYRDNGESLTDGLSDYEKKDFEKSLRKLQEDKCEGANPIIVKLIESFSSIENFAKMAMDVDGRGHFLSSYDGTEREEKVDGEYYYIYKN